MRDERSWERQLQPAPIALNAFEVLLASYSVINCNLLKRASIPAKHSSLASSFPILELLMIHDPLGAPCPHLEQKPPDPRTQLISLSPVRSALATPVTSLSLSNNKSVKRIFNSKCHISVGLRGQEAEHFVTYRVAVAYHPAKLILFQGMQEERMEEDEPIPRLIRSTHYYYYYYPVEGSHKRR